MITSSIQTHCLTSFISMVNLRISNNKQTQKFEPASSVQQTTTHQNNFIQMVILWDLFHKVQKLEQSIIAYKIEFKKIIVLAYLHVLRPDSAERTGRRF